MARTAIARLVRTEERARDGRLVRRFATPETTQVCDRHMPASWRGWVRDEEGSALLALLDESERPICDTCALSHPRHWQSPQAPAVTSPPAAERVLARQTIAPTTQQRQPESERPPTRPVAAATIAPTRSDLVADERPEEPISPIERACREAEARRAQAQANGQATTHETPEQTVERVTREHDARLAALRTPAQTAPQPTPQPHEQPHEHTHEEAKQTTGALVALVDDTRERRENLADVLSWAARNPQAALELALVLRGRQSA